MRFSISPSLPCIGTAMHLGQVYCCKALNRAVCEVSLVNMFFLAIVLVAGVLLQGKTC
jgi:hypothetical protein